MGALRVRGVAKRRRAAGEELAAETEMAWDDSALAITVNPMERLAEEAQRRRQREQPDTDDESDSDASYHDDEVDGDSSDCDDVHERRHGPHDLEWDHRDV